MPTHEIDKPGVVGGVLGAILALYAAGHEYQAASIEMASVFLFLAFVMTIAVVRECNLARGPKE